jgi:hypothetical protein
VRVVFPDGSEFIDAPVAAWDLMVDLALIGPVKSSVPPITMVDGENLVIGSDVYLIGYPGEVEAFPAPTITRGLVSRLRLWESMDITYFQTDASIAGGQSGGVLVSEMGEVIGISGFSFTEAGFGIVASAADLQPRIDQLIAEEDISGLGDRTIRLDQGTLQDSFLLRDYWDTAVYVLNEPGGMEVSLEVSGDNDATFGVVDSFGNSITYVDDGYSGTETGSLIIDWEVPHFVVIGQYQAAPASFQISGSSNLFPYHDRDDGALMAIGDIKAGSLDYPGDYDYYGVDLGAGQVVHITLDSILIDPFLTVDYSTARVQDQLWDDNSGEGLFGLNAEMTYQAPQKGRYYVIVADTWNTNTGGYILTVSEPDEDGPAPVSPAPRPEITDSPHGQMAHYEGAWSSFSMDLPATWLDESRSCKASACFSSSGDAAAWLTIFDYQLEEPVTLAAKVEMVLAELEMWLDEFVLVSRDKIVTSEGQPAVILVYTGRGGTYEFTVQRLIYVHQDGAVFDAIYATFSDQYETLRPMIGYSLNSLQVTSGR